MTVGRSGRRAAAWFALALVSSAVAPLRAVGQGDTLPRYARDRGTGLPTSMFGTYVRQGELLVYPFFEYYRDHDLDYSPAELGYGLDQDFRGRYRATEGLIFVAYGLADWLAIELEATVIQRPPPPCTALPLGRSVFVKLNSASGVTSKATDWAPEIGVMFSIPRR